MGVRQQHRYRRLKRCNGDSVTKQHKGFWRKRLQPRRAGLQLSIREGPPALLRQLRHPVRARYLAKQRGKAARRRTQHPVGMV